MVAVSWTKRNLPCSIGAPKSGTRGNIVDVFNKEAYMATRKEVIMAQFADETKQRLADQIREEFRKEYDLSEVKTEIIKIIAEKLRQGCHSVVIAFSKYATKVELKQYRGDWYEVPEKFRIPIMDYIRLEGFNVKSGPLCSVNYEVML